MAELTELVDAETADAGRGRRRRARSTRRPRRRPAGTSERGRVTMWLAIGWLGFIVFSAVGANWLPYVKHSCSQYATRECSTHVKGTPLKIERPPVWAFLGDAGAQPARRPERAGWFGTDRNGYDIFSRAIFGARVSLVDRRRSRSRSACSSAASSA